MDDAHDYDSEDTVSSDGDETQSTNLTSSEILDKFPASEIWTPTKVHDDVFTDDVQYILHGRLEVIPPARSKVVRVFLSSTFTDMSVERNALIKNTFPKIKATLRDKFDLDFQVVDMRWGVRHDAVDDHSSSELCMRELKMCQRLSIGPTFVTFLGQRYGSRPLPATIHSEEMGNLLDALKSGDNENHVVPKDDIETLVKWYRKDENSVPAVYVLQPISSMSVDHEEALNIWSQAEPVLSRTLRKASQICFDLGKMTKDAKHRYFQSVTDEEVQHGLLYDEATDLHCLCFRRTLQDINLQHIKAKRFIDIDENGEVDKEAQNLLQELCDVKVRNHIPKENLYNFNIPWSDDDGVNPTSHAAYLEDFCRTFENAIMRLTTEGFKKTRESFSDKLYVEVLEHAHQSANKCERFFGRSDIIDIIKTFVLSKSLQPLIIHGESGCGKTSILAKSALLTPAWLGNNPKLTVATRFLGTTPGTSSISATLTSICEQIYRTIPMNEEFAKIPQQFADLKEFFLDILEAIPKDSLLVIYLDSLDQLSAADNAHKIKWLPVKLPMNVKLVVSTLPSEHSILDNLSSSDINDSNYIQVGSLKPSDSLAIVNLWLEQQQRKITEAQLEILQETIKNDVRPLFLKLIFDSVVQWKSYEDITEPLPSSIKQSIKQLFEKLEEKHGDLLVSRAFGYLTASKNGLTETEMEDILSLDDDVLSDVFQFHVPPIRRLPSILWSRIRADISEYIVDREADDAKVMSWYHRQFIESAQRYFPGAKYSSWSYREKEDRKYDDESEKTMIENLVNYFLGTYSCGKKKVFSYTEKQAKKLMLNSLHSEEDRYLPDQPCVFMGSDSEITDIEHIRYNRRKISELPHLIELLSKVSERKMLEELVFNAEFLMSWIATQPFSEIGEFLELEEDDKLERSLMQQCLLLSYTTLYTNPFMLGPTLCSRMLIYKENFELVTKFIEQADTTCRRFCALVPPHMNMETPGGELLYVINNHNTCIHDCAWGMEGDLFVSISDKVVIINMQMGQVMADVKPRSVPHHEVFHKVKCISNSNEENCIVLAVLKNRPWFYAFEPTEGHLLYETHLDTNPEFNGFQTSNMHVFEEYVVAWSTKSMMIVILNATDGSIVSQYNCDSYPQMVVPSDWDNVEFLVAWENQSTLELLEYQPEDKRYEKEQIPIKSQSGMIKITCYTDVDGSEMESTVGGVAFATSDGELFFVNFGRVSELASDVSVSASEEISEHVAKKAISPVEVNIPDTDRFSSNCMKLFNQLSESGIWLFACLEKQLVCLGLKENKENNEYVSKVLLRITKRYDRCQVAHSGALLFGCAGGTVDIFGIREQSGLRAKLISTIEAHPNPITKLLPVIEGSLFMSSGSDGSLKFWNLEKTANAAMIPSFDRTREAIKKVETFSFKEDSKCFALVSGVPGDVFATLSIWNIITGKLLCEFKPASGKAFVCSCVVHKWKEQPLYKVVALNSAGDVLTWDITQILVMSETGQVVKTPSPQISQGCVPKPDVSSGCCFKALFDGSKSVLISKAGSWYLVDVFQAIETSYVIGSKRSENLMISFEFMSIIGEGILVAICRKENAFCLRSIDIMTGKVLAELELDKKIKTIDSFKVSNEKKVVSLVAQGDDHSVLHVFDFGDGKVVTSVVTVVPTSKGALRSFDFVGNNIALSYDSCLLVFELDSNMFTLSRPVDRNLGEVCFSPDGKYLVYIVNQKDVYLIRMSNKAVLARYTMNVQVNCLSVSCNSWYVLMGTADKRLFVMLIGDPEEEEHTRRIRLAREVNPGLSKQELQSLADEVTRAMSSSDELDIDFDEAASLIDMEETQRRRAISRNYSKLTAGMVEDLSLSSDNDDDRINDTLHSRNSSKGDLTCNDTDVLLMSSELCCLQ